MATAAPPESRPAAGQALIRRVQGAEESGKQRLVRKHLPAWVGSGVFHVMLVVAMITADSLMAKPPVMVQSLAELTVVAQAEEKQVDADLTNPEVGIDPELIPSTDSQTLADVNVETAVQNPEAGVPDAKSNDRKDFTPLAGISSGAEGGATGDSGLTMTGIGGGGQGTLSGTAFDGRGGATRSLMVSKGGGNSVSEAAVAQGILWLTKQQKPNGSWVYDGTSKGDTIAATGMALLPLLAAGQTHKSTAKDNKYKANVDAGIKYLIANQQANGSFKGSSGMYAHAIATIAFCELLGMSGDRALASYAQKAVNYIVAGQGNNGSWGYQAGTNGDTSIVGWQIQALQSARLCKDLVVDKKAFERCRKFLDTVSTGANKSQYGYNSPAASVSMTPVGLLCRYYADGWGPNNPGMAAGVSYILKSQAPKANFKDIYYYYYATQIMHFFEGKEWYETWNPAMRDLLIGLQVPTGKKEAGSWDPDGKFIGDSCGRLGVTCMSLLTLEVYYRHLPLYKRDTGGLKELELIK